jgi:outer membrane protein assembly factor BamB
MEAKFRKCTRSYWAVTLWHKHRPAGSLQPLGEVRALRSENGREIWRVATRGLVSWVTEAQGTVYVCSNNLYAVRAADGRRLWSFPIESTGPTGLITAPGVVYVGSVPACTLYEPNAVRIGRLLHRSPGCYRLPTFPQ